MLSTRRQSLLHRLSLSLLLAGLLLAHLPAVAAKPDPWPSALPRPGVYVNGEQTGLNAPAFAMLGGAKQTLDIAIYQMTDADFQEGIRRALRRGVRVRVVKEPSPAGDACDVFRPSSEPAQAGKTLKPECVAQRKLREEILAKGGAYVPFAKKALCGPAAKNCYLHGKLILADSKLALISTGNFNPTSLCNLRQKPKDCNRDYTAVEDDSQVVRALNTVFERDLASRSYDLREIFDGTSGLLDRLTVSPLSLDPILDLIHSAQSTIELENQYLEDPTVNAALAQAARERGVKVRVTLASFCAYGMPKPEKAAKIRETLSPLIRAGVAVRTMPARFRIGGKPGYLHSKAILVDGRRGWIGSVNGSETALSANREFGLLFGEAAWIAPLARTLKLDHESPDSQTWEESLGCAKDRAARSRKP